MSPRERLSWLPGNAGTSGDAAIDPSRRSLVKLLGLGGLVIAAGPGGIRRLEQAGDVLSPMADPWTPHVFVRVADDGIVTILCHRSEMGQGIRTTMPMIIADEMEADWAKCRVEQAIGDAKYGNQNTDGSTSIRDQLTRYREAGATVRALMEDAAAKAWGVPVGEVRAQQHQVVHAASRRTLGYGALVASARSMAIPAKERLRIKTPAERRWQGKRMPGIDLKGVTTGTAQYGADIRLPGMKFAVVLRPPVWGGSVASVDDSAALKVPGVERVIRIPESPMPTGFLPLGGVAVVAKNTWAALRGREALKVTFTPGPNGAYDSATYKQALYDSVAKPGKPGRSSGDVAQGLASAAKVVKANYYMPHLSHAQMEPVAAIVDVKKDGTVEAWAPTQSPQDAQGTIAQLLKVEPAKVTVHVTLLGGAFGRKSKPDFICEAAYLSKEVGAPVRVQWSREDDMRHGFYHAVAGHHLEAGLDASGKVTTWLHRSAYPSISATFAPNVPGPTVDELVNGATDVPWDVPNMRVEVCPAVAYARTGWFRSVNAIHHGFAIGSFVDELARAAGKDPAEFLLELIGRDRQEDLSKTSLVEAPKDYYGAAWTDYPMDTARYTHLVRLAMEKSGWGGKLPRGRGRGIAVHRSFLTYVAMVVEVEVLPDGTVLVPRTTVAVDAGFVANPDRARSQMEGALIMAMSNTLYSEVSFAQGKVVQANFRDYQVTRMRAAPHVVDVHLVESEALPGGIGEPGVPPACGAIANAIFAATGVRVRELPVGKQLAGWMTRAATEDAGA